MGADKCLRERAERETGSMEFKVLLGHVSTKKGKYSRSVQISDFGLRPQHRFTVKQIVEDILDDNIYYNPCPTAKRASLPADNQTQNAQGRKRIKFDAENFRSTVEDAVNANDPKK
jgi:hypothetical protein